MLPKCISVTIENIALQITRVLFNFKSCNCVMNVASSKVQTQIFKYYQIKVVQEIVIMKVSA